MSVTQLFDVGRVCIKTAGREAGRKCVVVDIIDKNFVLITGPKELTGVKRRRVNIDHLEPLDVKLNIKKGADDKEVAKALKKAFPEEFLKVSEEVKEEEEKKRRTRKKAGGES